MEQVFPQHAMMAAGGLEGLDLPQIDVLLERRDADVQELGRLHRCQKDLCRVCFHYGRKCCESFKNVFTQISVTITDTGVNFKAGSQNIF